VSYYCLTTHWGRDPRSATRTIGKGMRRVVVYQRQNLSVSSATHKPAENQDRDFEFSVIVMNIVLKPQKSLTRVCLHCLRKPVAARKACSQPSDLSSAN